MSLLGLATRLVAARGVLFRVGWRYFGRGEKTEEVSGEKRGGEDSWSLGCYGGKA